MKRGMRFFLLLCAAMVLFYEVLYQRAERVSAGQSVYLPVIMYHSVLDSKSKAGKYTVTPAVLEQDLQYLKEHGYTAVLPSEVIAFAQGKGSLPARPVMLTFDDGYYNNYTYVYPLLEQYDMRALISVVGSFTQQYSVNGAPMHNAYSHLSWDLLREMLDSGRVEIGNHSYDMHRSETRQGYCRLAGETDSAYIRTVAEDMAKMQRLCEAELGRSKVQVLTYPYGAYEALTEQTAKDMGFAMTLNCYEACNVLTYGLAEVLHALGRYNRAYGESTETFMARILPSHTGTSGNIVQ